MFFGVRRVSHIITSSFRLANFALYYEKSTKCRIFKFRKVPPPPLTRDKTNYVFKRKEKFENSKSISKKNPQKKTKCDCYSPWIDYLFLEYRFFSKMKFSFLLDKRFFDLTNSNDKP